MDNNLTNFEFGERILKPDISSRIGGIDQKIGDTGIVASLLRGHRQRKRNQFLEMQDRWNPLYEALRLFFEEMQNNRSCAVRYNPRNHVVLISGEGEIPVQGTYNGNSSLGIRIGCDNAKMRFVDSHRLRGFSEGLSLRYYFTTYFSLGGRDHEHREIKFKGILGYEKTFDILKIYEFTNNIEQIAFPSPSGVETYYFCGEPGRVVFRGMEDALGAELKDALFDRGRMQIQGSVLSGGRLVYAGQIKFDNTSFPFFVNRDGTNAYEPIRDHFNKIEGEKLSLSF